MNQLTRLALATVVGVGLIGLAGCSSGPKTGVVTGVVTLNGKAVETGSISVLSSQGGEPKMAWIGQGGKYTVHDVPAGPVTIAVSDFQDAAGGSADDIKKRGPAGPAADAKNNFPAKYADHGTSGLATTVQESSKGETTYDVKMTK